MLKVDLLLGFQGAASKIKAATKHKPVSTADDDSDTGVVDFGADDGAFHAVGSSYPVIDYDSDDNDDGGDQIFGKRTMTQQAASTAALNDAMVGKTKAGKATEKLPARLVVPASLHEGSRSTDRRQSAKSAGADQ